MIYKIEFTVHFYSFFGISLRNQEAPWIESSHKQSVILSD